MSAIRKGLFSLGLMAGFFIASLVLADVISSSSTVAVSNDVTITQLSLAKPSGVLQGELLLASIAIDGGSPASIIAPSGWTLIARADNDTNVSLVSYWKVVGVSEPSSYVWNITPQTHAAGGVTRYSGVEVSNPVDVVASSTGRGTVATAPSVTTSNANERVLTLFATNVGTNNGQLFATTSGFSKKYDIKNVPFGPALGVQDRTQVSGGSTGSISSSFSNAQREWVAQTIALRPKIQSLGNGLVAYWKFDGNPNDATGNGHTLIPQGNISFTAGKINNSSSDGNALSDFWSNSDSVFGFTSDFSLSTWYYPTTLPACTANDNNAFVVAAKDGGISGNRGWSFAITNNHTNTCDWALLASGDGTTINGAIIAADNTLQNNHWYHVVLTYSVSTGVAKVYRDGVLLGSANTGANSLYGSTGDFVANWSTEGSAYTGHIDELGVWNRVLTPEEVSDLYNSGNGIQYPF